LLFFIWKRVLIKFRISKIVHIFLLEVSQRWCSYTNILLRINEFASNRCYRMAFLNISLRSCFFFMLLFLVYLLIELTINLIDIANTCYYWIFDILIKSIRLKNILTIAKTDIWEINKHHLHFFKWYLFVACEIKELKNVLI
jgi:hypothetical protein